jgi:signal recognition particle subunit SRP72
MKNFQKKKWMTKPKPTLLQVSLKIRNIQKHTNLKMKTLKHYTTLDVVRKHLTLTCCEGFIGEKKYQEALEILKEAKLKCEENGKKDELEQDDIDYDMAIINVQIGFVLQMMGKKEEAKEFYTNLISSKIQDLSSRSIARNNLLVLRENKDLFDSLKQMKLANSTKSLATLNLNQQKLIQWNYCLLLMNMDSNKECSEILEHLMKQYQQEESFIILHAALKSKEKKFEEATIILNEFLKKFPKSNDVKLFLSQMHLTKGNVEESLNILNSLENKFEPSIVSSIISLMNRLGLKVKTKIRST